MATGGEKSIAIAAILAFLIWLPALIFADTDGLGNVDVRARVFEETQETIGQVPSPGATGSFFPLILGNPAMIINGGAAKTGTREAGILFNVQGAFQMQTSNRRGFGNADWEPFDKFKLWQLEAGDGQKTVWARFKNLSGVSSKSVFASIVLDTTAPANISGFFAEAGDRQVFLYWENPPDDDFVKIRIMRREDFYPQNSQDGIAVYDGPGEFFTNSGLANGKTYYYAAFAYDDLGNQSSGALAAAIPGKADAVIEIPKARIVPDEIENLDLTHFEFIQNGEKIIPKDNQISVDRFQPFKISIPYESVPEVLKTIMVTLGRNDEVFSFLLRINKEKTAYEAALVPPDIGDYDFCITILDYKNQMLKKIGAGLRVFKTQTVPKTKIIEYAVIKKLPPIIYISIILFTVFMSWKIYHAVKKKRKKSQITNHKLQTNHSEQITNKSD